MSKKQGKKARKPVPDQDPAEAELRFAVRTGDVETIQQLLRASPALATARFAERDGGTRTALHLVADWPGYFPAGPQVVALLIDAGADPDARTTAPPDTEPGSGTETPLHWAASSDDVDVAQALIDGGASLEAPGGSIGTPLDNAVGYSCWHVARLLVARGARVERAWQAAALGLLEPLRDLLGADPSPAEVSQAFWHACDGGQRRAAEYLLGRGAELDFELDYASGTPLDAASGPGTRRENMISWLSELGAQPAASQADAGHGAPSPPGG